MIETVKTLNLNKTNLKLNEAKTKNIGFKSNPNNALERTPETDKVEDKKSLSTGVKWVIGLGLTTIVALCVYALTKGKSKPKTNPTFKPETSKPDMKAEIERRKKALAERKGKKCDGLLKMEEDAKRTIAENKKQAEEQQKLKTHAQEYVTRTLKIRPEVSSNSVDQKALAVTTVGTLGGMSYFAQRYKDQLENDEANMQSIDAEYIDNMLSTDYGEDYVRLKADYEKAERIAEIEARSKAKVKEIAEIRRKKQEKLKSQALDYVSKTFATHPEVSVSLIDKNISPVLLTTAGLSTLGAMQLQYAEAKSQKQSGLNAVTVDEMLSNNYGEDYQSLKAKYANLERTQKTKELQKALDSMSTKFMQELKSDGVSINDYDYGELIVLRKNNEVSYYTKDGNLVQRKTYYSAYEPPKYEDLVITKRISKDNQVLTEVTESNSGKGIYIKLNDGQGNFVLSEIYSELKTPQTINFPAYFATTSCPLNCMINCISITNDFYEDGKSLKTVVLENTVGAKAIFTFNKDGSLIKGKYFTGNNSGTMPSPPPAASAPLLKESWYSNYLKICKSLKLEPIEEMPFAWDHYRHLVIQLSENDELEQIIDKQPDNSYYSTANNGVVRELVGILERQKQRNKKTEELKRAEDNAEIDDEFDDEFELE